MPESNDKPVAHCFLHHSLSMPLNLSSTIYMQDPDESSGSFVAFCRLVAPHMPCICRLHAHVFGDRVYDFYCLLGTWDIALPTLKHFSL